MEIYTIEALLLVFLILITCAVIFCKDILSAAIIYSAFSFCAVLLYLMMGSPDWPLRRLLSVRFLPSSS